MGTRNTKASRAKLFIPFDALEGFQEALREKEKNIVEKSELTEEEIERISFLLKSIKKRDIVEAIYFQNGEYLKIVGMVSSLSLENKKIKIIKTSIDFNDLKDLKIIEKFI